MQFFEALKAYTVDAAYASFDENILGKVKAGYFADLVFWDFDPTEISQDILAEKLWKNHQAFGTMINGKFFYKQ